MKYTKYVLDREITNPIQSILFITTFIIFAPYRFLSEMFKRILFLGEYTRKVLIACLALNLVLLIVVVSKDISLYRGVNLFHGSLSIGSLSVSLLINLGLFTLFTNTNYPINLNKVSEVDLEHEVNQIESLHNSLSDLKNNLNKTKIPKDETLTTCIAKHIDVLEPEEDVVEVVATLPKIDVDDVYKFSKEEGIGMNLKKTLDSMLGRNNMNNYSQDGNEIMSTTKEEDYKKVFGVDKETLYGQAQQALDDYDDNDEDEIHYEIHKKVMEDAHRKCKELDASRLPNYEELDMYFNDNEEVL